ncbi:MAG: DNA primase [Bacteroidales bacterium]|nr:DNA primase [Bacteroidales bacterium]MDD4067650.1 DNA primase [Bacteroidales bacterium]MDD4738316.1 DNA primase [Bacteroidales bacterium]
MIKQEDISKILEATEIVDVINAFVPLRKRGVNYLGNCPFHNEKTPSFTVSPSKGIFKCFGCGESGNAVNFIMKHEHYSYPEALKFLANKYGIEIQEDELTSEEKASQDVKDALFHVTEFAQKYFADILFNDDEGKKIGLSYFIERDLKEETIKRWGLGYCKDNWSEFTEYAKKHGYTDEVLIKSGLTIAKEETHVQYDRFRARVMFPIYNIGGRPLGFTGRVLSSEKTKAKYVNSPESDIYSKSKVLFGLHLAKNEIVKQDLCYLVEGNMDAIMLSQNNVENVVATSGTALTIEQIRLIKRYTKNVTVLYDGDSAGIKAAFRAIDLFVENGLNVKIVLFPDDEDPDSYCRKLPQDDFKAYITDKAENFILFKTHLLLEDAKDDPFKRSALIKEIINTISLIPDNIEKAAYIQQCSSILNMKEEILNNHLTKLLREKYFKKSKEGSKETNIPTNDQAPPDDLFLPDDGSSYISNEKAKKQIIEETFPDEAQERNIISILLNYGDKETTQTTIGENGEKEDINYMVAAYLVGDIVSDNLSFDNKLYQNIFDIYKNYIYEQGNLPELNVFTNNQDSEIQKLATTLLINNYSVSDLWEKKWKIIIPNPESEEKINQNVKESLLSFKLNKLERKIISNEEKLKEEDDYDNQLILMSEQKILKKLKQIISSELNRIVTR